MKTILIIILILKMFNVTFLFAQNTKKELKIILQNQVRKYNLLTDYKKSDYRSIINFASKGRFDLYQSKKISLDTNKEFTLLEGFNTSSGVYIGFVFCKNEIHYYKNISKNNWHYELLKVNNEINKTINEKTGLSFTMISKVINGDYEYIDSLNKQLGCCMLDGYSFVSTRINSNSNNTYTLKTIYFQEF